jgi:TolB-like protein
VLGALEALHGRGIVHRDLKPSNVFLTQHGVKLLDFGLARPFQKGTDSMTELQLTQPGTVVGTPRYMAPEQWAGQPGGPSCDLFALGALLFEMLTGKPAFGGSTILEVCRAISHEQPPALTGEAAVVAMDRVIRHALEKRPEDRTPSADEMARQIRAALLLIDTQETTTVRTMRRLIVLPFRVLRADPETDFLASSLPDAITGSLAGLESLVVRSSAAASRFAGEAPDLRAIASEVDVDVVLLGSLLRARDQVRLSAQLVEAPAGTILWSKTAQVPLNDIFQLQDDLAHQIVESLSLSLTPRERGLLGHDVPASPRAYEMYLRANNLIINTFDPANLLPVARDLYLSCLAEDPRFAPAWARLGRIYRVMAKYGHGNVEQDRRLAEEAFRKALEISPDLPVAHNLYTYFEVEELGRAPQAMVRLLERAQAGTADPDLYAGLVLACRFCGLVEASVEAHQRARRLDPNIRTSVAYTHWFLGDYERAMGVDDQSGEFVRCYTLSMLGRGDEALRIIGKFDEMKANGLEREFLAIVRAEIEGKREECLTYSRLLLASGFHDPEGIYFVMRILARIGESELALQTLDRVVRGGFYCHGAFARDPWLDSLRTNPEFTRILRRAEAGHREAADLYVRAGGERVLGVPPR